MTDLMKKQIAILQDTVEHYRTNPRSLSDDGSQCKYRGVGGAKCAVGRFIPEYAYNSNIEGMSVIDDKVLDCLPSEIKELGWGFLSDLQMLHDDDDSWSDPLGKGSELSVIGNKRLNRIKLHIKNEKYAK